MWICVGFPLRTDIKMLSVMFQANGGPAPNYVQKMFNMFNITSMDTGGSYITQKKNMKTGRICALCPERPGRIKGCIHIQWCVLTDHSTIYPAVKWSNMKMHVLWSKWKWLWQNYGGPLTGSTHIWRHSALFNPANTKTSESVRCVPPPLP